MSKRILATSWDYLQQTTQNKRQRRDNDLNAGTQEQEVFCNEIERVDNLLQFTKEHKSISLYFKNYKTDAEYIKTIQKIFQESLVIKSFYIKFERSNLTYLSDEKDEMNKLIECMRKCKIPDLQLDFRYFGSWEHNQIKPVIVQFYNVIRDNTSIETFYIDYPIFYHGATEQEAVMFDYILKLYHTMLTTKKKVVIRNNMNIYFNTAIDQEREAIQKKTFKNLEELIWDPGCFYVSDYAAARTKVDLDNLSYFLDNAPNLKKLTFYDGFEETEWVGGVFSIQLTKQIKNLFNKIISLPKLELLELGKLNLELKSTLIEPLISQFMGKNLCLNIVLYPKVTFDTHNFIYSESYKQKMLGELQVQTYVDCAKLFLKRIKNQVDCYDELLQKFHKDITKIIMIYIEPKKINYEIISTRARIGFQGAYQNEQKVFEQAKEIYGVDDWNKCKDWAKKQNSQLVLEKNKLFQ